MLQFQVMSQNYFGYLYQAVSIKYVLFAFSLLGKECAVRNLYPELHNKWIISFEILTESLTNISEEKKSTANFLIDQLWDKQ